MVVTARPSCLPLSRHSRQGQRLLRPQWRQRYLVAVEDLLQLGILANPSYAGAHVFGRYQSSKQVSPSGDITNRLRPVPQEAWRVAIPDHHESYIDWNRFITNRHSLSANRTNDERLSGPAQEGLCLLQGILLCGDCGRRLTIRYGGNGGIYPVYQCSGSIGRGWRPCAWSRTLP
jgi:hypothetical protein